MLSIINSFCRYFIGLNVYVVDYFKVTFSKLSRFFCFIQSLQFRENFGSSNFFGNLFRQYSTRVLIILKQQFLTDKFMNQCILCRHDAAKFKIVEAYLAADLIRCLSERAHLDAEVILAPTPRVCSADIKRCIVDAAYITRLPFGQDPRAVCCRTEELASSKSSIQCGERHKARSGALTEFIISGKLLCTQRIYINIERQEFPASAFMTVLKLGLMVFDMCLNSYKISIFKFKNDLRFNQKSYSVEIRILTLRV